MGYRIHKVNNGAFKFPLFQGRDARPFTEGKQILSRASHLKTSVSQRTTRTMTNKQTLKSVHLPMAQTIERRTYIAQNSWVAPRLKTIPAKNAMSGQVTS